MGANREARDPRRVRLRGNPLPARRPIGSLNAAVAAAHLNATLLGVSPVLVKLINCCTLGLHTKIRLENNSQLCMLDRPTRHSSSSKARQYTRLIIHTASITRLPMLLSALRLPNVPVLCRSFKPRCERTAAISGSRDSIGTPTPEHTDNIAYALYGG